MINRKKYMILIMVLIIITVSSLAAYAAKDSVWEKAGQDIKNIHENPDNSKVVALIDDEEVTQINVEIKKAFLTLQGKKPSKNEILNAIAYDKILIKKSKQRELYPSQGETLDYMNQLRDMQDEAIKNGDTNETYDEWIDYLAGRGMSEDEYWESEEAITGYQYSLAIARLRSALAEEWGYTPEKLETPQQINEFEETFNKKINERVQQAKKEIIEESVFE